MKKIILTIAFILFLAPTVMAKSVAPEQQSQAVAIKEVKAVLNEYVKYENAQDLRAVLSYRKAFLLLHFATN